MNFNEMLHEQRGKLLAAMPTGAKTVLSAGCSGGWYFDWFATCYGSVENHIGVELYSPKPEDLPTNVSWIANSVAKMTGVADSTVDLVFSGQNVEHLPESDLLGFLLEANRVLRSGGTLVIDSPNRDITLPFGWAQPEHTLEFSVMEMERLLRLAGVEVTTKKGIWHCASADSIDDQSLDINPNEFNYRIRAALDAPTESFIWWIEAKKVNPCQADALERAIHQIYVTMLPPFVARRFRHQIGTLTASPDGELSVHAAEQGFALYGPYIPLVPGTYEFQFTINIEEVLGAGKLKFDITSAFGQVVHAEIELNLHAVPQNEWISVTLNAKLEQYTTAVEARVLSSAATYRILPKASIRRVTAEKSTSREKSVIQA